MISFLAKYELGFLALHILGTALGLGGATISDILFFRFLKDYRISKKEAEVLHILKAVVLGALFIIILSGLALYLPRANEFNQSPQFLIKALGVLVLTLNGVALHALIAPRLIQINLRDHKRMGRNWHRFAFVLGAISVTSWYWVFAIAMFKSRLNYSFGSLLSVYLLLLVSGILGSQVFETLLSKKAKKK